eukprot:m.50345 g.50345  ORF g.50345 m.50345 type:complete len:66 (-) comp7506_c0_seq3:293-490(-)
MNMTKRRYSTLKLRKITAGIDVLCNSSSFILSHLDKGLCSINQATEERATRHGPNAAQTNASQKD